MTKINRIEIAFRDGVRDAPGEKTKKNIQEHLGVNVDRVTTVDVYTIEGVVTAEELEAIAAGPFSDPVIQRWGINRGLARNFTWLVEVGFRPGVTDNVGRTAAEAVRYLLGNERVDIRVYTSRQYAIDGPVTRHDAERIASGLLANDLVQHYEIIDGSSWDPDRGVAPTVPRVDIEDDLRVDEIDLDVSDEQLRNISGSRVLALSLDEMKAVRDYFADAGVTEKRAAAGLSPRVTDVELEALAQTWSEHCKHKIFNAVIDYEDEAGGLTSIRSLFKTCIQGSTKLIRERLGERDWCRSVFEDNAGVIAFNDDYNLVYKVETHNSPSALDPYGGALTGIVGVNRDPFGTGRGSKLIFNTDVFCFADPFYDQLLPERALHPRRIFEGVREGVEHGGNKSGIPTVNGSIVFDDRYLGKPLVFCGTGGIMPARINGEPSQTKEILPGDRIVMAGGRVGKDGIHGATFSSEELHEGSPVTAVQIGDPITQKKMTDFLLVARDRGYYRAITDNGAGGLSSSVGEMATLCGGCDLDLSKAPLKYPGLQPWEILLSEAQERMSLAVPPGKMDAFMTLAERMGVEAVDLGVFTDSGMFRVRYGERTVAYLDMTFLHEGLPTLHLSAKWNPPRHDEPSFPEPGDLGGALRSLLARLNICSKEYVVRQYDHEVQGGSVIKPLVGVADDGPGDAAVLRPLLDSFEGIVVANGICPRYGDIDTYHMTACAIDEAVRNAIAAGGSLDRMAGIDNFCWCDPVGSTKIPDGDYKLAQLVRANRALYDYTTLYGVPCISGKDSMKNDYVVGGTRISIPPTVLFSVLGKIDDVRRAVTMDAKRAGDRVYVLGRTRSELGGSEWFALHGYVGNDVPVVRGEEAKALYEVLSDAVSKGLVASCHDCSDGGLGVALAETAFAGGLGMEIDLRLVPADDVSRNDYLLFSESQSRFVVTVREDDRDAFRSVMENTCCAEIGRVTDDGLLVIRGLDGNEVVEEPVDGLKKAWKQPLAF
ncbi:MAG: phosphoribosylformylglycinamidine synthase [delta proteobacterium MLS_D]|nr:MAG: phosphoribosylformylglycinamidine synthase [delta proteobacterium MLS_D]